MEGLRAVAVGLVLLYHAGAPVFGGGFVGVDVFFVISGFLITTLLLKEVASTGRISLRQFYARRAKRLLPAAATVLLVTALLSFLILPNVRWRDIAGDIVSSAMYVVNWRLADRSVDYLAEGAEPSPVQHFWSLAVEEQFYFVWPLLMILVAWWARRRGRSLGKSLVVGLAVVAVPSLAWSIYETMSNPGYAFFVTTTRMWELAIGGGIAIAARRLMTMPRRFAIMLGWAGLAAIVVAGVVVSTGTAWPGYAAALPTLGTAAVIAAGFAAGDRGPVLLLGTRPFRWLGGLSYSVYLWHWPLIVLATSYWGGLTVSQGLAIALISVIPAWLTYRLVENPMRHSPSISRSPRLALSLGANLSLLGVVAGLALLLVVPPTTAGDRFAPGAMVLSFSPRDDPAGAPVDRVSFITPNPANAARDLPDVYADGCQQDKKSSAPISCSYGMSDAAMTVALVGDSKAAQWLPALQVLAESRNWQVITYTKAACSFAQAGLTVDGGRPYTSCAEWNEKVLDRLTGDNRPDVVITSQARSSGYDGSKQPTVDAMVSGLRANWSELTAAGVGVYVLKDSPWPDMNGTDAEIYRCVAENQNRLTACTFDRATAIQLSAGGTQAEAAEGMKDVHVVDITDAICPTERCAPVIGNVAVWRQGRHLTATYVATLAAHLGDALVTEGLTAGSTAGAGEQ